MGASETSVYPDNPVILVDAVYSRAYINGAWEPRGDIPSSAVVVWIKPTGATPDPALSPTLRKAQDAIITAAPAASDDILAMQWMDL